MRVGIFADEPNLGTGFSTVCGHFGDYLSEKSDLKVMYFGRWGEETYFRKTPLKSNFPYDYIPCRGGTWDKNLVNAIIKHFKIDLLLTIDDWWSIDGLLYASKLHKIPFHFITPLDSLPIPKEAYEKFRQADAVYVPNRSWEVIKIHEGEKVNVKYLPYGIDTKIFKPISELKNDKFTFLWIGRNEPRKNLNSAILAFKKIQTKNDVSLLIKTNWNMSESIAVKTYIKREKLPVIREQSEKGMHGDLVKTYNRGHVLLCTSKAGGFELQIIEAMGCEIPALVTDWNFMNEHIINGQNGFKIPYKYLEKISDGRMWANIDEEELANCMEFCINHQEKIVEMGRLGRKYIQQKYDWEDWGEVLYKSIVGENKC